MSSVIDVLFADLPRESWGKLEVYTFGSVVLCQHPPPSNHFSCAANHFNNPPKEGSEPTQNLQIRHIEHYANEHDFVAMFGVLQFTSQNTLQNRFAGQVFTHYGVTGHLFATHYLEPMFMGVHPAFLDEVVGADGDMGDAEAGRGGVGRDIGSQAVMLKELSRLWKYKDGRSPE